MFGLSAAAIAAIAVAGAAVVGGIAANSAADEASDAATYAADLASQTAQGQMSASERAAQMQYDAAMASAEMMAGATRDASAAQERAAQEALAEKKRQWEKMQADMAPYLASGGKGLNQLSYGLGLQGATNQTTGNQASGYLSRPFSEADFQTDPGYAFRLSEGMKALDRTAASRGNLLSGATLKGATRFNQDMASNEYQNAYNRYAQNQGFQYNQLARLADMGQSTAVGMGHAGANFANSYGQTLTGNAAAQAGLLTGNAAYSGQQSQYGANAYAQQTALANQYMMNGSNALGNAALQKANINSSLYQGYANQINNLASSLGQYYSGGGGYNGGGGGQTYNMDFTPAAYQTNYGSYTL